MKKVANLSLSMVLMALLSACGGTDTSTTGNTGGSNSNMGGSNYDMNSMGGMDGMNGMDGMDDYSMESGQTYDSDSNSNGSSGDSNSQNSGSDSSDEGRNREGGSSDRQNQAGGYQSNMAALNTNPNIYGNDDDSGSGDGSPRYYILGDVQVDIEGQQPFALHTAADTSHIIAPPYHQINNQGSHTVYISAYSIAEDRVNDEVGSIMFKFTMPDMTVVGCYPLEYPLNAGAQVCVENVQTLNGSKRVLLEGYIQDAPMYTDETQTETFLGSVKFTTQVIAYQQD